MDGVIRKREILCHPRVTIESFGWNVFLRAVVAGGDQTFLSVLSRAGVLRDYRTPASECMGRCVAIERGAMRVYHLLSSRHARKAPAREFFDHLSQQEAVHADLLEMCQAAAARARLAERWRTQWLSFVPGVEKTLAEAEASLDRDAPLVDSLRLVIRIESTHVNELFTSAVNATVPRFAERFSAFRNLLNDHLEYIRQRIPALEPGLESECEEIKAIY